ncbi:MAG: DUF1552 domain-containing protein [Lentisphaeraceae bacterium]|nr:DUF1552 domain-containing protein [Lentisphaeraceae bacterium]
MSNISTNKWLLDRRHFLRGSGAALALPLLNCMIPSGYSQNKANKEKPKRSVFVYFPNGVNVLTWQMTTAGKDYQLTDVLKSLEKHRNDVTHFSGMHHPNGIGQAHVCADLWLTSAQLTQSGGSYKNSVSCDQLMAEVTAPHTRFSSLQISIAGGVGSPQNSNTLSWSSDGIPLPAETHPRNMFNRLFGIEKGKIESKRRKLDRRGSVLDTILSDAKKVRKDVGTEDRTKLDEYLQSVREVEVRTERMEAWLDVPKPEIDGQTKGRFQRNVDRKQAGDYYRTIYDLMALTLQTDMTRVITYMSGTEGNGLALPEVGISQTRHQLSHHNSDPEIMARLTKSDTFLTEQFSYFLDKLKSIDEQGESLLDRSMVLYGSGMSYGHSHGNANLPTILAGGKSLGLKHGTHIDYNIETLKKYDLNDAQKHYHVCTKPVNDKARLSNILLTMMQKMDVKADKFVDSNGVISEILA